jgi:hypothetical protein
LILLKKLRKLRIGVAGENSGKAQRRRAGEKITKQFRREGPPTLGACGLTLLKPMTATRPAK